MLAENFLGRFLGHFRFRFPFDARQVAGRCADDRSPGAHSPRCTRAFFWASMISVKKPVSDDAKKRAAIAGCPCFVCGRPPGLCRPVPHGGFLSPKNLVVSQFEFQQWLEAFTQPPWEADVAASWFHGAS
jgi:hypothetical protein